MSQQVDFKIPVELATSVLSDKCTQCGDAVRDTAGNIVKNLKNVDFDVPKKNAIKVANKAAKLAKRNKKIAIGAVAVAGVSVIGSLVYSSVSRIKLKKQAIAYKRAMNNCDAAIYEYLSASDFNDVTLENIEDLENAIDKLKQCLIKQEEIAE